MEQNLIKIAIRRQDKSVWQGRTPLTPQTVKELLHKYPHLCIKVQPSSKRIFSDEEYQNSGAIVDQDITDCSLIMGIKQIPPQNLIPDKTYLYFSHVNMGVPMRMPALDSILQKNIRLIDYEEITDQNEKRLIAFGKYAGIAGAIDFLKGFGEYLMKMGVRTPFLHCNFAYKYFDLNDAYENLKKIGKKIKEKKIPKELSPVIFAVTGRGRSGEGVMEVLNNLAVTTIKPEQVQKIWEDRQNIKHQQTVYIVNINTQDCMVPLDQNKQYSRQEFYSKPQEYKCNFNQKYLPYISALFHTIYWKPGFPKYIMKKDLSALKKANNLRMIGICDIAVDIDGSIQMLQEFTTPDQPFFYYDIDKDQNTFDSNPRDGKLLYLALDFLPSELALDASEHFSHKLREWVDVIAKSDKDKPLNQQNLPNFLQKAVIACNNKLTPRFEYITKLRQQVLKQKQSKNK